MDFRRSTPEYSVIGQVRDHPGLVSVLLGGHFFRLRIGFVLYGLSGVWSAF